MSVVWHSQICEICVICGSSSYLGKVGDMGKSFFDGVAEMRDPRTYAIIGAAMEVHKELGSGFLEAVYQEALAVELAARNVPFEREAMLTIKYKDVPLTCKYRADFICFGDLIVEIKALAQLTGVERSQVIHYLKSTGFHVGLLINFGAPSLQYERLVFG